MTTWQEDYDKLIAIQPSILMLTEPMKGMLVGVYRSYTVNNFDNEPTPGDRLAEIFLEELPKFDFVKAQLRICMEMHKEWGLEQ